MTATPLVSFVIASYNHEKYIGSLLASLKAQTFADFEAIIVDDASRDASVECIERSIAGDARFKLYRSEVNRGLLATKNFGLEQARGELVSIVDSDDTLPAGRTALHVEALQKNPGASFAYGNAEIIDSSDRALGDFFSFYPPRSGPVSRELFLSYCFVPNAAVAFRRSKFLETGPLWGPPKNADYLKWIELGLVGEAVVLRDKILGAWRWHGENASGGAARSKFDDYTQLCEGLKELLVRQATFAKTISSAERNRRFARCYFMAGVFAAVEGDMSLAHRAFSEALQIDRSALNRLAVFSTFSPMRLFTRPMYRAVAKRKLGPFIR